MENEYFENERPQKMQETKIIICRKITGKWLISDFRAFFFYLPTFFRVTFAFPFKNNPSLKKTSETKMIPEMKK